MMLREIAALSGGHVGGARRSRHAAAALLLLVFLTLMGTASRAGTPAPAPEQHPETGAQPGEWLADAPPCTPGEATGRAVLPFIENLGQTDDKIAFCARTFGGAALVTRDGKIVYALAAAAKNPDGRAVAFIESVDGLQAAPSGLGRSETRVSEFRGNDPARWRTDLPAYEAVDLGTLPGGIRVVLEAHAGNVEMLFVVPPGADPQEIRVSVDGARSLAVNGAGELVVATALGDVAFTAPVAHQEQEGTCEFIDVAYETDGGGYSFTLGKYDPSLELVIDPLLASTFLGGSAVDGGYCGNALALDAEGNVYVAGYTASDDFPHTVGAPYHGGASDVFVAKFDRTLTTLIAATFIGGPAAEEGSAITIGNDGSVYVTGGTMSSAFPTTVGAYDRTYGGSTAGPYNVPGDVFVAKLDHNLSTLVASTFYGGSAHDYARAVALDVGGHVYITGATTSSGLATTGAFDEIRDPAGQWGGEDAYVARLSGDLGTLEAATYLGGNDLDFAEDMTLTASGVYVTGWTASDNYPRSSAAYDTTFAEGTYDAFVTGLDYSLANLVGSTYLGGTSWDFGYGMTSDAAGYVYVTGHMAELGAGTTFPTTPGCYDPDYNGTTGPNSGDDLFISKFDPALTSLVASTLLGGSDWEYGNGLEWHASGHVYVTGCTTSEDLPTHTGAYQPAYGGDHGTGHFGDGFVSKLTDDLTALPASTFLGGSGDDFPESIVVDAEGNAYVSGTTSSSDHPITPGAYEDTHAGGENDAFVTVLSADLGALSAEVTPATGVGPLTVDLTGSSTADPPPSVWQWDVDDDGEIDTTGQNATWTYDAPGLYTVRLVTPQGDFAPSVVLPDCVRVFDGGSALRFDGDGSHVVCQAAPDLNLTEELTLETWIRPDTWGGFPIGTWGFGQIAGKENVKLFLVGSHPSYNGNSLCLKLEHADATSSASCAPDSSLVLGEWQHVAATYDASTSTVRMWIDGTEVTVTSPTAPSGPIADHADLDLTIGNSSILTWSFEGDIDELRIWEVPRSGEEIAGNIEQLLSGEEPGLVAYWRMDEGNGDAILDRTNSGHAGALAGAEWVQGVLLYATSVPENPLENSAAGTAVHLANHPNPFNPSTTVAFQLPRPARVSVSVYDVGGRLVRKLIDERLAAGPHRVAWDGRNARGRSVASGVYLARLSTPGGQTSITMVLLR